MVYSPDEKLTRITVFYDGGFLANINDYYKYHHPKKSLLSIEGIHEFAALMVAEKEKVDDKFCSVIEAHYFRGRFAANEARDNDLRKDREFDETLMKAGVITHYLVRDKKKGEAGIDVWFALEAFEAAVYKRFNVLVLIAGDADYIPLVRKLNSLGTRVMLLGWNIKFPDGTDRGAITNERLIKEVNYFVEVDKLIDSREDGKAGYSRILFGQ